MKKYIFLTILLTLSIITLPNASFAVIVYCSNYTCGSNPSPKIAGTMCATTTTKCYGNSNTAVVSCATCPDGFVLTPATEELQPVGQTGTCTVRFSNCEREGSVDPDPDCDGTCDDCESTDWEAYSSGFPIRIGYQRKVTASCNIATCECTKMYSYRCADGYYGLTLNGTSGCSMCPSQSEGTFVEVIANSIAGSNQSITDCFVSNGIDTTGSYIYTPSCYYTN